MARLKTRQTGVQPTVDLSWKALSYTLDNAVELEEKYGVYHNIGSDGNFHDTVYRL